MWGWHGYHDAGNLAPRFFRINPNNHSGRRLYKICGPEHNLIVTNSCPIVQSSANHHGKPDPVYVAENLNKAFEDGADLFLICGRIAQETYKAANFHWVFPNVYFMDHPASRRWTVAKFEAARNAVAGHANMLLTQTPQVRQRV